MISFRDWRAVGGDTCGTKRAGDWLALGLDVATARYEAALIADHAGSLLLDLRSPRPLRVWIDGILVLDEDLFWRSFQRQLFATIVLPIQAGQTPLRVEIGDRPRHPAFVDQSCSSPGRAATMVAVAARFPDQIAVRVQSGDARAGAFTCRFLPQQHVADDMLWQHVLVRPLSAAIAPPSTAHASPADRPRSVPTLIAPLGVARPAPRAAEERHGIVRYHVPIAAMSALPEPLRSAGAREERAEPAQEITGYAKLSIEMAGSDAEIEMPLFEALGRKAPHRPYRQLNWPDAAHLRAHAPTPVLPADLAPLIATYDAAWSMLASLTTEAAPDSGLPNGFLTTGSNFTHWQFVWDTAFSTFCTRYAHCVFPATASLDVLYSRQFDGGYIHRQHDVRDGSPALFEPDFSPNPPLLSTAELGIARLTGDVARLHRVYPLLVDHHRWLVANRRNDDGSFWTSSLASGCDNAPSLARGYPDLTAQMVQDAESLADIAALIGRAEEAAQWQVDRSSMAAILNDLLWNEASGFYCGRRDDGTHLSELIVSGFWPLWAGVVAPDRVARLREHLLDEARFARPHPIPSLAANASGFRAEGRYWVGSVWPPTNYATIAGLWRSGERDLARRLSLAHIEQIEQVRLTTGKIWENYSSEAPRPGSPAGPDFVWSALGPIALLLEIVIGLEPDALARTITWHLPVAAGEIGVKDYAIGTNIVSLIYRSAADKRWIEVDSDGPLTLVVNDDCDRHVIAISAGKAILTPWGGASPTMFD